MKLRVKENERLVRDSDSFAILNTDPSVLSYHEKKMAQLRKQQAQEDEINNIKSDVAEIKALLHQLLEKR